MVTDNEDESTVAAAPCSGTPEATDRIKHACWQFFLGQAYPPCSWVGGREKEQESWSEYAGSQEHGPVRGPAGPREPGGKKSRSPKEILHNLIFTQHKVLSTSEYLFRVRRLPPGKAEHRLARRTWTWTWERLDDQVRHDVNRPTRRSWLRSSSCAPQHAMQNGALQGLL